MEGIRIMKWQPIETAPKDGTVILVYDETIGVFSANWWEIKNAWFAESATVMSKKATHWMPLPELPKQEKE